jgi:hypothetical protein
MRTTDKDIEKLASYEELDKWIDCTGFVAKNTSYYFEIQSLLDDQYQAGFTAGAMSQAKRIKELEDALSFYANVCTTMTLQPEGEILLRDGFDGEFYKIQEKAREALKQGGEE